jgi:hypothetical protein
MSAEPSAVQRISAEIWTLILEQLALSALEINPRQGGHIRNEYLCDMMLVNRQWKVTFFSNVG